MNVKMCFNLQFSWNREFFFWCEIHIWFNSWLLLIWRIPGQSVEMLSNPQSAWALSPKISEFRFIASWMSSDFFPNSLWTEKKSSGIGIFAIKQFLAYNQSFDVPNHNMKTKDCVHQQIHSGSIYSICIVDRWEFTWFDI